MSKSIPIDEVLIVDDDVISLFAQQQLLQGLDMARQITAIEDGEQAIDFIKNNWMPTSSAEAAKGKKLLLLDLRMPNMSGMEFLERFTQFKNTEDIAIVVLSAIVPEFIRKNAKTFNVVDCFDKPLTKEKVEQILDKL